MCDIKHIYEEEKEIQIVTKLNLYCDPDQFRQNT